MNNEIKAEIFLIMALFLTLSATFIDFLKEESSYIIEEKLLDILENNIAITKVYETTTTDAIAIVTSHLHYLEVLQLENPELTESALLDCNRTSKEFNNRSETKRAYINNCSINISSQKNGIKEENDRRYNYASFKIGVDILTFLILIGALYWQCNDFSVIWQ